MVTREDLKFISTESYRDGHTRDVVQYEDKFYIVGSVKCPVEDVTDEIAVTEWLSTLDGQDQFLIAMGFVPLNETFVMEAKWDELDQAYVPKNECGEHCETGVCNKRLASNQEIGDHGLAYRMLLNHLNA